jgi:DNA-binding CsgD family transcriptional regulator
MPTKDTSHLTSIRQICCYGFSPQITMPVLLKSIRELVPCESAGFFWVNAHAEISNFYAERLLPEPAMQLFFERYHDGVAHSFRDDFRKRAAHGSSVQASTPDAEFVKGDYYNDILRELDAHHVMRAVVRDGDVAIGQLSLYRAENAKAFSTNECDHIAQIARYIGHALAAAPTLKDSPQEFVDTDDEGVIIATSNGQVKHAANGSRRLLLMATHPRFSGVDLPLVNDEATQRVIGELIRRLQAVFNGNSIEPPRLQVATAWGQFVLRAYWLDDQEKGKGSDVAVHIRRREALLLRLSEGVRKLDLPTQMQQVAVLIAQGHSNHEIAKELNVKENTVRWHVKQLFNRLELHDRSELMSRLRNAAQ